MNLIASADKNWGIGFGNKLLVRIPDDMKYFRSMTVGKVVVMGRKTLESFPGGQPLKDRVNIVLTNNKEYKAKGAVVVYSIEGLLRELEPYKSEDIYIIGGESIYRQTLSLCDVAYITKIAYEYQADSWLMDFDAMDDWELTAESEEQTYFDLVYYFLEYRRKGSGEKRPVAIPAELEDSRARQSKVDGSV